MWSVQKHLTCALTTVVILSVWLSSGCKQNASPDRSSTNDLSVPKTLAAPAGDYTSVAWLADDKLAFVYESSSGSPLNDCYVALYSEQDSKWEPLKKTQPKECQSVYYRQLNRLPDGGLGFLVECYTEPTGFHFYLYEQNVTGTLAVLFSTRSRDWSPKLGFHGPR